MLHLPRQTVLATLLCVSSLIALPGRGQANPLVSVEVDHYAYAAIGVVGVDPETASLVGSLPLDLPIDTASTYGLTASASTRPGANSLQSYGYANLNLRDGSPGIDELGEPIPADPTLLLGGWQYYIGDLRDRDSGGIRGWAHVTIALFDVIEITLPDVAPGDSITFDVLQDGHEGAAAPLLDVIRFEKSIDLIRSSTGEVIHSLSAMDFSYPWETTRIDLTPYAGESLRIELTGDLEVFAEESWGLPTASYAWRTTTEFEVRMIPEPSSFALVAIGLVALGASRRRP
jgi:hypothetical protein